MRKTFVIDTSVLAHDPSALNSFKSSLLIIPIGVVTELDKLKSKPGDVGRNARLAARQLDELSVQGDISKGIKFGNKCTIKIDCQDQESIGNADYTDNRILACALRYAKSSKLQPVTVVSRDVNLRIRSRAAGIFGQDYEKNGKYDASEIFKGYREIVSDELGATLYSQGYLECDIYDEIKDMVANECLSIISTTGRGLGLGKKVGNKIQLIKSWEPWGIKSRSKEQAFAFDLLQDKNVNLVSLTGLPGGGKSFLAMAAALQLVMEDKHYSKIRLFRPLQPLGKDVGYLPGDLDSKISEYYALGYSLLEELLGGGKKQEKNDRTRIQIDMWMEKEIINFDPITFIRGKTFSNSILIIDEAQNVDLDSMRALCTRLGNNSKIIVTGDQKQQDLDNKTDSSLITLVEAFKGSPMAGTIMFSKSERSAFAAEAYERL